MFRWAGATVLLSSMRIINVQLLCSRVTAGSMVEDTKCSDQSVSLSTICLPVLPIQRFHSDVPIYSVCCADSSVPCECSHGDWDPEQSSRLCICRVWQLKGHGWSVSQPSRPPIIMYMSTAEQNWKCSTQAFLNRTPDCISVQVWPQRKRQKGDIQ